MKKIKFSEITPEKIYLKRRDFIKKLGLSTSSLIIGQNFLNNANASTNKLEPTEYRYISTYNNYYEFGTRKSDPVEKSQNFKTEPWNIKIDGEVENKINISALEINNMFESEERTSIRTLKQRHVKNTFSQGSRSRSGVRSRRGSGAEEGEHRL